MKQRTGPILLTSLMLGLVFDWFFYGKVPGISVGLYAAAVLGCTFCLAFRFKDALNTSAYWLAPVILFFSFMVYVRADPFLAFMNSCVVLYLLFLVARLMLLPGIRLREYGFSQYLYPVTKLPIRIERECLTIVRTLLSYRSTTVTKASYIPILRGVMLSLPILFVFLLLLSSADLVFKEYLSSIFSLNLSPQIVFQWCLIGFVASLFAGAYALIFMPSYQAELALLPAQKKFAIGFTESSIILGSVGLLFFVFVLVQLAYLFDGTHQITGAGFTYAQYARKGFFELIAVAAISLALLSIIKTCTTSRTMLQALIFKGLSGVLVVEVIVIMISAHLRLNLYQEAYGFTELRLLSHLFILWLAYAFAQLLYQIIKDKSDNDFAFHLFISALCFFALINCINPDKFIAQQNIQRFNSTGQIDLYYLSSLSEDAVPTLAQLLDHPNKDLQKGAAYILFGQKQYATGQPSHWQSANLGRQRADRIFKDNAARIEAGESYSQYKRFGTK
ncbi:MAG: hypothetical protein JWM81_1178 [Candidatus Saccharibacteria bacterium]|nr:hypothetical protein [Candidatus Saccharibacteria bacterium]